jgi:hypothetical protein
MLKKKIKMTRREKGDFRYNSIFGMGQWTTYFHELPPVNKPLSHHTIVFDGDNFYDRTNNALDLKNITNVRTLGGT